MSLYSALTQVLAPFAAKIKGIQTGYDGTEYTSPGEAVREQINDLHVLIGHVPGQAIDASAVAYNNSNVAAELTNVNGRLQWYPLAVNVTDGSYVVGSTGGIDTNANLSYAEVSVLAFRGKGITIQSYLWEGAGFAFLDVNGAYIYGESANTKGITPGAGVLTKVETSVPYNAYSLRVTLHRQTYSANTGRYFFTIGENKATKVVFIGDSYGTGYNTGGSTTGWIPGTAAALGLKSSDFESHAKGGAGFRHPANTDPYETFTDLLNTATLAKEDVGRIIVCGGYNDHIYTVSQLLESFRTFATKAREKYPFAEICVGMIGHTSDTSVQETIMNTTRQAYTQMANVPGVRYLSNVECTLTDENVASDQVHPNQAGATALGTAVGNAVKTGSTSGKVYDSEIADINGRLREQQSALSAVEEKVPVVDAVAENYTEVKPDNWHNAETDTEGILKADGTTEESTTRFYTDYIAVSPGDKVRAYNSTNHNKVYFFNYTYYDSGKVVMPSAGRDTSGSYDITVPEGAAYIRITFDINYQSQTIITINLVPTNWNIQYFDPYYTLSEDMLTAGTKSEIDRIIESGGATLEPVKGYNLLPLAENGIGACYASGTNVVRNESYNTYHWAVIPVTEGKRYYINRSPDWWILADDNDTVKASGRYFSPASKRYVDVVTGATRLYVTYPQSTWVQAETYGAQFTIIVAEGINGTSGTHLAPTFVTGLTQRMRKSTYACALPKAALRCTVGIEQKWYQKNMFSVDGNYASIFASSADAAYNYKWRSFTPNSTGEKSNGFYYMVYDDQMALVDQLSAITEYFYADNVANASTLVIGDSTVDAGRMTQTMLDMWTERGKTLTLLGTRGTAPNLHEGRSGAAAKDYCTSTTAGGVSNPFYNSSENKFDFSQYMTTQGYASVDYVIIQLGTNDIFNASMGEVEDVIAESMGYICQIIDSILTFNSSQKILINLPAAVNPNASTFNMKFKHNIFVRFNAAMLLELTKYNTANVRVSYNHLRLDPETDINDHVHPTQAGYAKMGVEMFSQINAWQKG